jgi:hypothetical protein
MLLKVYPHVFPTAVIEVTTWVDSTSALRRLQLLYSAESSSRSYPADADLSSHIVWLWAQTPQLIPKFAWVKAHQDDVLEHDHLTQPAKLNILADRLATEYLQQALLRPRNNPLFFPSTNVSLIVNGQRVTTKYSSSIRFHIQGTRQRNFLQQRNPDWSDCVWKDLDFEGIGLAFRMLDVQSRLTTSKMLHGWQNTGHQRVKIHPGASSQCPHCLALDETQEHVLRCSAQGVAAVRYNALIILSSSVVTRCGGSKTWTALVDGIRHWLIHGTALDGLMPLVDGATKYSTSLQHAIKTQTSIGWKYALRGYLSTGWVYAYSLEHPKTSASQIRSKWLRHVIRSIWTFGETMWRHRNNVLHDKAANKMVSESAVNSQIQHYYEHQDEFAASDRALFDIPLETRLATTLNSRKHWLVLIRRYQETTQQRRLGQQHLITKFFTRPPPQSLSRPAT